MNDPNFMAALSILTALAAMFLLAILWDCKQHARVFVRRVRAQRAMRAHERQERERDVRYFSRSYLGDHGISPREIRESYPTFFFDINCGNGVQF
jgi:hypothetical protein